ncbi:monocarboxylate transporter 12-like, partial [Glandiceps talaboti]
EEHRGKGRWRWLSVVGLFINAFFVRGTLVSLGIFFVALSDYFKEGAGTTSWIISISPAIGLIMGPISTACAKRYGYRKVVMTGGVLSFLSIFLSSFATRIWHLVASIGILNGLAYGLAFSPAVAYPGLLFKRRHSFVTGLGYSGIGVGSIVLPIIFQICLDQYGWRGSFMIYAAMTANICVCAAFMRPINSTTSEWKDKIDDSLPGTDYANVNEDLESSNILVNKEDENIQNMNNVDSVTDDNYQSKHICNKKRPCAPTDCKLKNCVKFFDCHIIFTYCLYDILCACQFVHSMSLSISTVHLAPLLISNGLSVEESAILLSFFGIGTTIGGPFFGFLASHFQVNIIKYIGCGYAFYGTMVLAICFFATNFVSGSIITFLLGFGRGWFCAQSSVTARKILGDSTFTTGYGWLLLFAGLAQLIGPPISGYLKDYTGSYQPSFSLASLMSIMSGLFLVMSVIIYEKWQNRQQSLATPNHKA